MNTPQAAALTVRGIHKNFGAIDEHSSNAN